MSADGTSAPPPSPEHTGQSLVTDLELLVEPLAIAYIHKHEGPVLDEIAHGLGQAIREVGAELDIPDLNARISAKLPALFTKWESHNKGFALVVIRLAHRVFLPAS